MSLLLPCPFCGSNNLRYEFAGSQGYICCNECCTEGPCDERAADPYCEPDAASAAWNRRLAEAMRLQTEPGPAPSCVACEGRPSPDNSPCHICGQSAQPEPQGPSVEVMAQIVYENAMLATAPEHAKPHWPSWNDLPNSDARIHSLNTAEIILACWGRPAIEPVLQQGDVHYAWELHDAEGEWQAGGSANSLEDVQREGNRYLQSYSQDGPHKLIIERHCVTTVEPAPPQEVE